MGVISINESLFLCDFFGRKFFTRQVAIAQKFPRRQGNNLAVAFFVSLPDGNDIRKNGHTVIPELSLERVVQACSENISSVVGVAIQSVESYDAGTDSSSLTDYKMNYIMIPLSFGTLAILCFVAGCFHLTQ